MRTVLKLLGSTAVLLRFGVVEAAPEAAAPAAPAAKSETADDKATVLYKIAPEHSIFDFDYGPPTSPALSLLGLTPDKTPASTSLTKFVIAVPGLIGGDENKSVALDFAPAALSERPGEDSFTRYASSGNWLYRLSRRSRINLAFKNGSDKGDPAKDIASGAAAGFSVSLLDSADPLVTHRDASGTPYILRCLNQFTPLVDAVFSASTLATNPDLIAAETAVNRLSRALAAAKAGDAAAARGFAAPYLAVEATEAQPAPAAKPVPSDEDAAASDAVKAIITDPELASRLGTTLAAKLADALRKLEAAANRQGATGSVPPSPAGKEAPTGAEESQVLARLIAARLLVWEKKRDTLLAAQSAAPSKALDARVKNDLGGTGVAAAFAACSTRASQLARFSADLDIGGGILWQGRAGRLSHLDGSGQVVWVGLKLPIPGFVQFPEYDPLKPAKPPAGASQALMAIAYGRFGFDETVMTGNTLAPAVSANTIDAWTGVEFLRPDLRLTAQYGWTRAKSRDGALSSYSRSGDRFLLTSQVRVGSEESGLWLGASYGNGSGSVAALKAKTALVTVSYSPPPPDIAKGR